MKKQTELVNILVIELLRSKLASMNNEQAKQVPEPSEAGGGWDLGKLFRAGVVGTAGGIAINSIPLYLSSLLIRRRMPALGGMLRGAARDGTTVFNPYQAKKIFGRARETVDLTKQQLATTSKHMYAPLPRSPLSTEGYAASNDLLRLREKLHAYKNKYNSTPTQDMEKLVGGIAGISGAVAGAASGIAGEAFSQMNANNGDQLSKKGISPALAAAGLCIAAADTGRVLLLQRALDDNDPASGKWEAPGGHIEPGEGALEAARREWSEEIGARVPRNIEILADWTAGIYIGFVGVVPSESDVKINKPAGRRYLNPDDPDGDRIEVAAWWSIKDLTKNKLLRKELADTISDVKWAVKLALLKYRRKDKRKTAQMALINIDAIEQRLRYKAATKFVLKEASAGKLAELDASGIYNSVKDLASTVLDSPRLKQLGLDKAGLKNIGTGALIGVGSGLAAESLGDDDDKHYMRSALLGSILGGAGGLGYTHVKPMLSSGAPTQVASLSESADATPATVTDGGSNMTASGTLLTALGGVGAGLGVADRLNKSATDKLLLDKQNRLKGQLLQKGTGLDSLRGSKANITDKLRSIDNQMSDVRNSSMTDWAKAKKLMGLNHEASNLIGEHNYVNTEGRKATKQYARLGDRLNRSKGGFLSDRASQTLAKGRNKAMLAGGGSGLLLSLLAQYLLNGGEKTSSVSLKKEAAIGSPVAGGLMSQLINLVQKNGAKQGWDYLKGNKNLQHGLIGSGLLTAGATLPNDDAIFGAGNAAASVLGGALLGRSAFKAGGKKVQGVIDKVSRYINRPRAGANTGALLGGVGVGIPALQEGIGNSLSDKEAAKQGGVEEWVEKLKTGLKDEKLRPYVTGGLGALAGGGAALAGEAVSRKDNKDYLTALLTGGVAGAGIGGGYGYLTKNGLPGMSGKSPADSSSSKANVAELAERAKNDPALLKQLADKAKEGPNALGSAFHGGYQLTNEAFPLLDDGLAAAGGAYAGYKASPLLLDKLRVSQDANYMNIQDAKRKGWLWGQEAIDAEKDALAKIKEHGPNFTPMPGTLSGDLANRHAGYRRDLEAHPVLKRLLAKDFKGAQANVRPNLEARKKMAPRQAKQLLAGRLGRPIVAGGGAALMSALVPYILSNIGRSSE